MRPTAVHTGRNQYLKNPLTYDLNSPCIRYNAQPSNPPPPPGAALLQPQSHPPLASSSGNEKLFGQRDNELEVDNDRQGRDRTASQRPQYPLSQ